MQSSKGNCMTEEVTEMPRCCSRRIQSEVAWRVALRPFTVPAIWMAPPNSSNFSVSVVLPASGCEMMAKVRRSSIASDKVLIGEGSEDPVQERRGFALDDDGLALGGGLAGGAVILDALVLG